MSAVERALGVGPGPLLECPLCHGSGTTWTTDGANTGWEFDRAFAEVARRLDVEYPDPGPEPGRGDGAVRGVQGWRDGVGHARRVLDARRQGAG